MTPPPAHVAGGGSLALSIIGTGSIERFREFYAGALGLDATETLTLEGPAFERFWQLPPGSRARAVLMSVGVSKVGRVLGIEFDARARARVATGRPGPYLGYWNLNFYVQGIAEACARLERAGLRFWTRPVRNLVAGGAGAPLEAICMGPDGVAINLVEPLGPPGSTVAQLAREIEMLPRTRTGYSQVATSAHATPDIEATLRLYRDVIGMNTSIDAVLESPAVNALTGRPRDARTRTVWLRGDHPYGKVALSQPLNYALEDRASVAVAPAIGYLAQAFAVANLDAALSKVAAIGGEVRCEPQELALPGDAGLLRAALMRAPGSGALVQLHEDSRT